MPLDLPPEIASIGMLVSIMGVAAMALTLSGVGLALRGRGPSNQRPTSILLQRVRTTPGSSG
jgi:hypothetical protein